jgi:NADP-dependent 3-hydroxy acid dehydrogenase YdfG
MAEILESPLRGKTALVTGASAGIGAATARLLAGRGMRVVLAARREERLQQLAKELDPAGGRTSVCACDCSQQEDIDRLFRQAIDFAGGALDAVVVNAGVGLAGGVASSNEDRWEQLYRLNVLGAGRLMRKAAEHQMKLGHGDIVVIGSVVGVNISPFSGFYGSSKFAVGAMAEALRREVCGSGVRVSTVKPGIVTSEFQDAAGYTDSFKQATQRFGKMLDPEDVARVIAFVLSQPPDVHVNDIMVRPLRQDYP